MLSITWFWTPPPGENTEATLHMKLYKTWRKKQNEWTSQMMSNVYVIYVYQSFESASFCILPAFQPSSQSLGRHLPCCLARQPGSWPNCRHCRILALVKSGKQQLGQFSWFSKTESSENIMNIYYEIVWNPDSLQLGDESLLVCSWRSFIYANYTWKTHPITGGEPLPFHIP